MSEQINEQISEFIDDEMSAEACEFFVRRLERDDPARACFVRYQMIGAAVRGEHLAFNAGASSALAQHGEAAVPAHQVRAGRQARGRIAIGVGLAASLVLVAVFAFQMAAFDRDEVIAQANATPQSNAMGMQYLMQHTGVSNGLGRPFMNSSLISGPEFDIAEEAADDAPD